MTSELITPDGSIIESEAAHGMHYASLNLAVYVSELVLILLPTRHPHRYCNTALPRAPEGQGNKYEPCSLYLCLDARPSIPSEARSDTRIGHVCNSLGGVLLRSD
jgi:hypothetical protein